MWKAEEPVVERARAKGWTVYRNGWPDLLLIKGSGKNMKFAAVEIKSPDDKLSTEQKQMHDALRSIGIPVKIVVQRRPITKPRTFIVSEKLIDDYEGNWIPILRNTVEQETRDEQVLRALKRKGLDEAKRVAWYWHINYRPEPKVVERVCVDRLVVKKLLGEKSMNYADIGRAVGVSRERIRQIANSL